MRAMVFKVQREFVIIVFIGCAIVCQLENILLGAKTIQTHVYYKGIYISIIWLCVNIHPKCNCA